MQTKSETLLLTHSGHYVSLLITGKLERQTTPRGVVCSNSPHLLITGKLERQTTLRGVVCSNSPHLLITGKLDRQTTLRRIPPEPCCVDKTNKTGCRGTYSLEDRWTIWGWSPTCTATALPTLKICPVDVEIILVWQRSLKIRNSSRTYSPPCRLLQQPSGQKKFKM